MVVGAGKPCGGVYYNADDEDPTTLMDDDYPEFLEQRIGKWRRLRYTPNQHVITSICFSNEHMI